MKSTTRRVGKPVAVATVATLLAGVATCSGAGVAQAADSKADSYLIVAQGGVSALSADALESTVERAGGTDVTTLGSIGTAVADLTASEAASLDAKPGFVVAKDAKMYSVEPGGTIHSAAKGTVAAPSASKTAPLQAGAAAAARSWGLDRVDQRSARVDGQYNLPTGITGAGVHAYVFDTGIALSHPEFAGRIGQSWDFVHDGYGADDCYGHGTHVAGTIGSTLFGVAPKATLHSVRVLDCDGSGWLSDLVLAMNTVAASRPPAASVANASMGGYYNEAVNQALTNFVNTTQMPFVVSAGNNAEPVSGSSPASAPAAITVAASEQGTDGYDYDASYSNYGTGVDLYAPGTDIWSTYAFDPTYKLRMSGTSMAAPHVAGYFALYFSARPTDTVAQAEAALKGQATTGTLRRTYGGTPNRMVHTKAITLPAKVSVRASRVSSAGKLYVDVNPNKGAGYWTFTVQKKNSAGRWVTYGGPYTTQGAGETRTLNFGKGWYRAVVNPKYGYRGNTSAAVYLKK